MAYKHQIIQEIKNLLALLQPHMAYFNIDEPRTNRPLEFAEKGSKTYAAKILEQLDALVKRHLTELDRIRGLISEERWQGYKTFGTEGLREQTIYRSAHRGLMREWKFRQQRKKKAKKKKTKQAK